MSIETASLPYFVQPHSDNQTVEVWSSCRLPFEPKGWLQNLRSDMKSAIQKMKVQEDTGLYAAYTSSDKQYFDIENVLLYNIGTGAFSENCRNSLCIEHIISNIPKCSNVNIGMPHHYIYKTVNYENNFCHWLEKGCLAKWDNIPIPTLKGENKPHTFWNAMKAGTVQDLAPYNGYSPLGLELKIKSPYGQKINLASVIKPLIDGVISSFHVQDGIPDSKATIHLSKVLQIAPEVITTMLFDSRMAVMGKRNLIHPFKEGIQWSPADDSLVAIKLSLEDCLLENEWQISGKLILVSEAESIEVSQSVMNESTIKLGRYRHFKGKEYRVLHLAKHSETLEELVVYQALYGEYGIWVRPASMWNQTVSWNGKDVKRFTYIGES